MTLPVRAAVLGREQQALQESVDLTLESDRHRRRVPGPAAPGPA